ncbi:arginase family protein [Cupriavidus basilensis]
MAGPYRRRRAWRYHALVPCRGAPRARRCRLGRRCCWASPAMPACCAIKAAPARRRGRMQSDALLANVPAHGLPALYDAGNVICEDDALEAAQERLAGAVRAVLDGGGLPLVLGGGHEVAWGSWQGLRAHLDAAGDDGRLLIVNIDAHFDLRTSRPASSGTPVRPDRVRECAPRVAVRLRLPGREPSRQYPGPVCPGRRTAGVSYVEDVDLQERHLDARLAALRERMALAGHVYLTIDLDALPAAVMPGVSAPAAFGVPLAASVEALLVGEVRRSG